MYTNARGKTARSTAPVGFRVSAGQNLRFSSEFWRPIAFSLKLNSHSAWRLHFRRINLTAATFSLNTGAIMHRVAGRFMSRFFHRDCAFAEKLRRNQQLCIGDLRNCVIKFYASGFRSRVSNRKGYARIWISAQLWRSSVKSSKIEISVR